MKPHQLQAFLAVAGHGSIRAAARELNVSQPAITRTMRELERELDVPLVSRGARGITLTEYGSALQVRARLLVEDMRRAREELQQIRQGLGGRARIGISSLPALLVLPRAFAELRRRMPQVEVHCYDGLLPVGTPPLRNGELDFLVTQSIGPLPVDSDVQAELLFTSPLAAGVRSSHPRARARSLAALQGDEWIGWDAPMVHSMFALHGLPPPTRVLISHTLEVLERKFSKFGLRLVRLREPLPELRVYAVMRRNAKLTPAAAQFLEILRGLRKP
jgi:DNA-binding transcriptional LysR family regulator